MRKQFIVSTIIILLSLQSLACGGNTLQKVQRISAIAVNRIDDAETDIQLLLQARLLTQAEFDALKFYLPRISGLVRGANEILQAASKLTDKSKADLHAKITELRVILDGAKKAIATFNYPTLIERAHTLIAFLNGALAVIEDVLKIKSLSAASLTPQEWAQAEWLLAEIG